MKSLTQAQLAAVLVATIVVGALVIMFFRMGTPPLANAPAPAPGTPNPPIAGGCVVGGCSGQLCTDASEGPAVSDCMYRPEYACYKNATCERQANGECGWTPTPTLTACLAAPPALQ
jgi:eight-cysteine-cluster-containing protein